MRKDIQIPQVSGVYVAAVLEKNEDFQTMDWNAYIINEQNFPLEMILIVSTGIGEKQQTSLMRHSLKKLPAKSFTKIEFLEDSVLKLSNEFAVTFFAEDKMFEKKFIFPAFSIKKEGLAEIPIMKEKGILAE